MNNALAATLLCLCCTGVFACEGLEQAQQTQQQVRTMVAGAVDEPAGLRRTVAQGDLPKLDRTSLYAQAAARDTPEKAVATAADGDDSSNTLLMVGLALMAGIAVRRWGAARR